jgi:hypothetical protein
MATSVKISFSELGNAYFDDENGEYEVQIDTQLPHRFRLVDGEVVDIYDGASDYEIRLADHQKAEEERLKRIEDGEDVEELPELDIDLSV